MEDNLSDALKMASAVLIFVIALSICIVTFTQVRETSEAVLYAKDDTNYYDYIEQNDEDRDYTKRVVGMETIIPTLYRYYKENYIVKFVDRNGVDPIIIYKSQKNNSNISIFDVNEEVSRREPWTGNIEKDYKLNLDAILSGGTFYHPSGDGSSSYSGNFLYTAKNNDYEFYETFGEYQYDKSSTGEIQTVTNTTITEDEETIELVKKEVKRVITYTLK